MHRPDWLMFIGNENIFDIERLRVKINNEAKNLDFGNLTSHNDKK